jgi:hypothetical protein
MRLLRVFLLLFLAIQIIPIMVPEESPDFGCLDLRIYYSMAPENSSIPDKIEIRTQVSDCYK